MVKIGVHLFFWLFASTTLLFGQSAQPASFVGTAPSNDASLAATRPGNFLVWHYGAYDNNYAQKMEGLIRQEFPGAGISGFYYASTSELEHQLYEMDAVVIPYAAYDEMEAIPKYAEALKHFVENGGTVVFTGTHVAEKIAAFGLLHPEQASFHTPVTSVTVSGIRHTLTEGVTESFTISNYGYTLKLGDPTFKIVCAINGQIAAGYKSIGLGKVIYLGFEYYVDETYPTMMLKNALEWAIENRENTGEKEITAVNPASLSVYPNPFAGKATIEVNLRQSQTATVEVSDETGRVVAVLANGKLLPSGTTAIEFPNIRPGVYFVKCISGESAIVKKVVKVITP